MKKVICILGLVVILSGCSGAKRMATPPANLGAPEAAQTESESRMASPGLFLNPQVVAEKKDEPEMPGEASASSGRAVIVDSHSVVFNDVIQWNSTGNLYLAWNADVLGSVILDGKFVHSRKGASGLKYSEGKRNNLGEDHSGRWFISLSEAVDQSYNEINSSDTHAFEVELYLQNGSKVSVSIALRLLTVPSGVVVTDIPVQNFVPDAASFLTGFNQSGVVIQKTNYKNPTNRPIALWVRGKSDQLALFAGLSRTVNFVNDKNLGDQREDLTKRQTPADLVVEIEKQGKLEAHSLGNAHWTRVDLGASQELTVHWKIIPKKNLPICHIQADSRETLHWRDCIGPCGDKQHDLVDHSWVAGMQFGGGISKNALVTDAGILEADLEFYTAQEKSSAGKIVEESMETFDMAFYAAPDRNQAVDECVGLVR